MEKKSTMPRNLKTQAQLQDEINQLKSENEQLRFLFRIIIEVADQAVNKNETEENIDTIKDATKLTKNLHA